MAKIFLFLLMILAAWLFFRVRGRITPGASGRRETRGAPETMVVCARCGVHVPMSESLEAAGRRYCSQEHLRLGSVDASR